MEGGGNAYISDGGQVGLCFHHGDIVAIRSFGLFGVAVVFGLVAFEIELRLLAVVLSHHGSVFTYLPIITLLDSPLHRHQVILNRRSRSNHRIIHRIEL